MVTFDSNENGAGYAARLSSLQTPCCCDTHTLCLFALHVMTQPLHTHAMLVTHLHHAFTHLHHAVHAPESLLGIRGGQGAHQHPPLCSHPGRAASPPPPILQGVSATALLYHHRHHHRCLLCTPAHATSQLLAWMVAQHNVTHNVLVNTRLAITHSLMRTYKRTARTPTP